MADDAASVSEDGRYQTHLNGTPYQDQGTDRGDHVRALVDTIVDAGLRYLEEGDQGRAEVRAYTARMSPEDQLAFQKELREFARQRLQHYEDRSGSSDNAVAVQLGWAATSARGEEDR